MIEIYLVLALHLIGFLLAYVLQTDKLTDISYAIGFFIIALFSYFRTDSFVLLLIVGIWAIRLGAFLGLRIHMTGSDTRFTDIRPSLFKFFGFWMVQALLVILISLPVYFSDGSIYIAGIFIALFGIVYETIADAQKFRWKFVSGEKSFCTTGLWKYSQHPNYFGEILTWIGIYIAVFPSLSLIQALIGLLSPIAIIGILLFASGVPMARERNLRKYKETYTAYMKSTSVLVPWFK